ncbi:Uncharacterized protein K02A2.6 [Stylophora pistillata]|uniref:Uncharacterized protein K02A2.6 n=1 Tax=Stylophora pistillata TaxID=50429 RepID=A0A2B4R876_STYPI|nr:Uncharacterized protein K02A2.6 [Stylophora pistillata]
MADSGASINILDEKEYRRLPNCTKLEPSNVKIYGYQSKVPLGVLGKFSTTHEYPVVEIVKSTAATTVIPKLDKVISEFGIPDVVRSDNGPPFNSWEFTAFADDLGFKHWKVTPKWARANGEVERFVHTVKKVVKTVRLENKSYKQELNRMLRNYRATPHRTTKNAPAAALFGRPMKTKLPGMMTPCSDTAIRQRDQAAKAKIKGARGQQANYEKEKFPVKIQQANAYFPPGEKQFYDEQF